MSQNSKGYQKGAQRHGEGQHGDRTHARFQKQLQEGKVDEKDNIIASHRVGKHRLDENREQHDKADLWQDQKRRDKNR
jgi:hypothetical protein